ncbi:primosomal protein N' (replication factor Y) - superfamily II helicase [Thioclava marina]|uniref:primosomal protein N' (replication factor Y) - superfamily II helicase n=1 Tax=Thioclava marina TaxID=1915077 RepID=UPI0023536DFB|nr:primosomal protein N' (replication factor Y) - superfamily II helicase [Thioclava marina]
MTGIPKVGRSKSPVPADPRGESHYHCESCGADLRFAPGQTRLVCDHCGHVQDIPAATGRGEVHLREIPLEQALGREMPAQEMEEHRTVSCPNCGATIELQNGEHATECPFCATPVVTDTGTTRLIKPQGVLPFQINEDQARAALSKWLGSLWFAPNGLSQYARKGRKMAGVYAPFWTFDADTRTRYTGQRGDAYFETRQVAVRENGRTVYHSQEVRRIRWTPVAGQVSRSFDDVLIYAARSLPPGYVQALQPWDLGALEPYRRDYLAGFSAEGYTVELHEGHHAAQAEMIRVIQSDIRRDIGGDEQRIGSMDPLFSAETFKHVLLPVWTAAYKFRGRSYRFVVNAQTGRVQGDRPWSPWKIAFAVIAALIVVGAIAYLKR